MASIFFGTVTHTNDPDKLGRVQVELHRYAEPLPVVSWLRVVQPMATKSAGTLFLPEVGDEVLLLRDEGGEGEPFLVLGCLYNGKNKPASEAAPASGKEKDAKQNFIKQLKTKTGHELTFNDEEGKESVTLRTGDGKLSILLDQKGGKVIVTGDKEIGIQAAQGKVVVSAKQVEVTGSEKVVISANQTVEVKGNQGVELSGGGASVKLSNGIVELG